MIYIIVALLLVLAPLLHFMPSKRQRHQARLREAAAVAGLRVEFRSLPQQGRAAERLPRSGIIFYGKRLPPSKGRKRRLSCAWIQESGEWRSLGAHVAVPEPLLALPPAILAASADEAGCGVYWQEQGDEQAVADIVSSLNAWVACL